MFLSWWCSVWVEKHGHFVCLFRPEGVFVLRAIPVAQEDFDWLDQSEIHEINNLLERLNETIN
jgi:hypothetical protein